MQKLTQSGLKTNVRPKTIKLLEENIGENLLDFGLGSDFLIWKAQATKVDIDKWYYIRIKRSAQQRHSQQNKEAVYGIWRNYLRTIYLLTG